MIIYFLFIFVNAVNNKCNIFICLLIVLNIYSEHYTFLLYIFYTQNNITFYVHFAENRVCVFKYI